MLVGWITFGIYTPMEIKVTCAASAMGMMENKPADFVLGSTASRQELRAAFFAAGQLAAKEHRAVYIDY
jgi:hypothetical protein